MIELPLDSLSLIWRESLVGGAVILVGVVAGWWAGPARRRWPVRVVAWWLAHVVRPVIASRSWLRRAVTIAANNTLVCATLVLLGPLGRVAWLGVACLGLGLGIALRLMFGAYASSEGDIGAVVPRGRVRELIGVALNLLEVPAIMLAAGLGLGQGALSPALDLPGALWVFGLIVFPLLVVSAAGEALWMGAVPDLPEPPPPA